MPSKFKIAFPIVGTQTQNVPVGHCTVTSMKAATKKTSRYISVSAENELLIPHFEMDVLTPFHSLYTDYEQNARILCFTFSKGVAISPDGKSSGLCANIAQSANLNATQDLDDSQLAFFTGTTSGEPLVNAGARHELDMLLKKVIYAAHLNVPIFMCSQDADAITRYLAKMVSSSTSSEAQYEAAMEAEVEIEDITKSLHFVTSESESNPLTPLQIKHVIAKLKTNSSVIKATNSVEVTQGFAIYKLPYDIFGADANLKRQTSFTNMGLIGFDDNEDGDNNDSFKTLYEKIVPLTVKNADIPPKVWDAARNDFLQEQQKRTLRRGKDSLVDKLLIEDEYSEILHPSKKDSLYKHIVISGPTGSGKTEIATAIMLQRLLNDANSGKGLYIGPLKALVEQQGNAMNKAYGKLLQTFTGQSDKDPVIISTGDQNNNDPRIRENLDDYALSSVITEKANIFALTEPSYLASLRVVIIDEIHIIFHKTRVALELFISKLRYEAQSRLDDPDSSPLTLIIVTTESTNFAKVFKYRQQKYSPFVLHSTIRPVNADHYLLLMDNTPITEDKFKANRIELANMSSDVQRKQSIENFTNEVISNIENLANTFHNNSADGIRFNAYLHQIVKSYVGKNQSRPASLLICTSSIENGWNLGLTLDSRADTDGELATEKLISYKHQFKKILNETDVSQSKRQVLEECMAKGVFFHNSETPSAIKNLVLDIFSDNELAQQLKAAGQSIICISSESLAYGLNLSTDLFVLMDYKFPRSSSRFETSYEVLTANEFHNIAGRCGRLLDAKQKKQPAAEVYLCLSAKDCFAKDKNSNKMHLHGDFKSFLYGMYCDIPESSYLGLAGHLPQRLRIAAELQNGKSRVFDFPAMQNKQSSKNKQSTKNKQRDLLSDILRENVVDDTLDLEQEDQFNYTAQLFDEEAFNRNLHSFLDAIWFASNFEDGKVELSAAIDRSLSYTLYANTDYKPNSFNTIRDTEEQLSSANYRAALMRVGTSVLGTKTTQVRTQEHLRNQGQDERIFGLNLVEIETTSTGSSYKITKAGQSLLATGTNYNTAKCIEFFVRLNSALTQHIKSIPLTFMLPALVYPNEVCIKMKPLFSEIKLFSGTTTNDVLDFQGAKELVDANYEELEKQIRIVIHTSLAENNQHNANTSDRINDQQISQLTGHFIAAIGFSIGDEDDSKYLQKVIPSETFEKLKSLLTMENGFKDPGFGFTDDKARLLKLKKSVFYRAILVCHYWLSEKSLSDINIVSSKINDQFFKHMQESKKDACKKKMTTVKEFVPNSNTHSQLIYKANNLINYFEGRVDDAENGGVYSAIGKLSFNAGEFERRMRFGASEENLPIATALEAKWSRLHFAGKNSRNGHDDFFYMFPKPQEKINNVETYWSDLRNYFVDSFETLKRNLLMNMSDEFDPKREVRELWSKYSESLDTAKNTLKTPNVQEFRDRVSASDGNKILFHGEDDSQQSTKIISIYAFLVLKVLTSRALQANNLQATEVYKQFMSGDSDSVVTVKSLMKRDCWNRESSVFLQLKKTTDAFFEPLPKGWRK